MVDASGDPRMNSVLSEPKANCIQDVDKSEGLAGETFRLHACDIRIRKSSKLSLGRQQETVGALQTLSCSLNKLVNAKNRVLRSYRHRR